MKLSRRTKRSISWIASLVLILTIGSGYVFAGGEAEAGTEGDESGFNETGYPIVEEPMTLTMWLRAENIVDPELGYNDRVCYQEAEARTGVKIEWISPAQGQVAEQFTLLLASGEYPDMIEAYWNNWLSGGKEKAHQDEVILDLTSLIDQYAPNITRIMGEHPDVRKQMYSDTGRVYAFPWLVLDKRTRTYFGPAVRQDWLDSLGLERPDTIAEWETVLRAFRDDDPNGNGEQDEVPLTFGPWTIKYSGAFVGAWGINRGFYNENGEVRYGDIQPEFKEFLTLFQQWYEEGLIDPDFATQSGEAADAKIMNDIAGSYLTWLGNINWYQGTLEKEYPNANVQALPFPTANEGEIPAFSQLAYPVEYPQVAVTSQCEQPEIAVRWLDYKYGDEGNDLFMFGVEDVHYEWIDGYPTFTDEVKQVDPDTGEATMGFDGDKLFMTVCTFPGPYNTDFRQFEQYRLGPPAQKRANELWSNASNEKLMPPITPTPDESRELGSLLGDIETYIEEMWIKFILGREPLENFDEFVAQVRRMSIDRVVEIQQAGLDRYNAR